MLRFKLKPMEILKEKGFTNKMLLEGKCFGSATMQKMREGVMVSAHELDTLCRLTGLQPGDLIEYVEEIKEPPQ